MNYLPHNIVLIRRLRVESRPATRVCYAAKKVCHLEERVGFALFADGG